MHVRKAVIEDIPAILTLGREMHTESPVFGKYNFDEQKVAGFFKELIERDHGIVFVLEHDAEVIGGFAGIVWPFWFGDEFQASDLALFIHPQHRGGRAGYMLLRAYVDEAKAKHVSQIVVANSTGVQPERVAQLIESAGFEKTGYVLVMHVPKGEE